VSWWASKLQKLTSRQLAYLLRSDLNQAYKAAIHAELIRRY
jgi:hypothetical protein